MIEAGVWQVIKGVVEWLFLPLVGGIAYFFRKYIQRVELVESKISKLEIRIAVVEVHIAHIRKDIEGIKKGVDKILDKL
jgi:predicted Na+-dependent transporter